MALNSHGKLYSIISTNEESYLIDIAKYAAVKICLQKFLRICHNEIFWTTYFIHKFHNTNKFLNEFDSIIKKKYSCHSDYQLHKIHILYVNLTQLTRTVTQVPLCNAIVKTLKWHWQSQTCKHQDFVVVLCLLSKMWPLLRLWVALSDNLGIIFGHNSRRYTNFNF